jgi:S1-C subfamily serine protease
VRSPLRPPLPPLPHLPPLGLVVAVNYAGDSTSARVVPINYVTNILTQLLAGTRVARGDAGLIATLIPTGDAVRHYKLPKDAAAAATAARGPIGGVPKVILVSSLNPRAPAADVIKPGDILYAADGDVPLADDLAALDRAMDRHVGKSVPVTVYRNGVKMEVDMPTHDLEALKTKRFGEREGGGGEGKGGGAGAVGARCFNTHPVPPPLNINHTARFAGGTFQDLSERTLLFTPVSGVDGVLLAYTDEGTSFGTAVPPRAVVTALNGVPTPTLDAFIAAAATVKHGDAGAVQYASSKVPADPGTTEITYDTRFAPLEVFAFDDGALEWVKEK